MIDELQTTLHTELPVTQHLGIRVGSAGPEGVVLTAPLESNRNHKGTAFAGSLNAIATLAGWSWVWLLLRRQKLAGHVVIQDSTIDYQRPVTSDFVATCAAPEAAAVSRFLAVLRRRGRGRMRLKVQVHDRDGPAVAFAGRYVAALAPPSLDGLTAGPSPDVASLRTLC
jgi:thioesterase domain-containing protein